MAKRRQKFASVPKPLGCGSFDGVSLKRDADGVFAATHRARSKSYPTACAIPVKVRRFIESTG